MIARLLDSLESLPEKLSTSISERVCHTVEFVRDCDTKPEEYIAYNEKEISNQLLEMFGDEYDNDLEFNDELKTIVSKIVNIN